jgi:sugar phosphate isomerase/epimerase
MEGPPDPADRLVSLQASMRRLAAYEPESVLVITGPVGDLDAADARRLVIDGLRKVAAAAREAGVRLGLEPIHPGQRESVSFVSSIADALGLLDEAGLDDVGIMADTYNLWHEPPETLAAVAGRVTGLHVADEPSERGRADRVLPGEGGTRSAEHVDALRTAGWDGYLDVEIFSTPDRFWALPADEAARRAYAAVAALAQTLP